MAAAQQLRRAGHRVVLFERDEAAGGLARFGVPDFKIEKWIVQRRIEQLLAEGVELRCGVDVGGIPGGEAASFAGPASGAREVISAQELRGGFDAIVLATGSRIPRDLQVPGRELDGVHFAMDYLYQRNRWVARELGPDPTVPAPAPPPAGGEISAAGRDVVVIGGGDTGADCVGNALREGARSIVQLELLPKPPDHRPDDRTPWPQWPLKYRLSYAMEEAQKEAVGEQDYSITTTHFSASDAEVGRVAALHIAQAEPAPPFAAVPGSERELPAQLVLLAMGFVGPEQRLLDELGVERDPRGNVKSVSPLHELGRGHLRRRRRPPRPVADRVGDQRGSPVRAHGRAPPRGSAQRLRRRPSTCPKTPAEPATPTPTKARRDRPTT